MCIRDRREYLGDYEYYSWKRQQEQNGEVEENAPAADAASNEPGISKKLDRKQRAQIRQERDQKIKPLQKQLKALEREIAELETEKEAITAELCDADIIADGEQFSQKSRRFAQVEQSLEEHFENWTAISEQIESIETEFENRRVL